MRAGDRITGFEALHRHPTHNYHVIDTNGRAVYCGCMPSIRHSGGYMRMRTHHRSKAYHLEQWYKEYKFERNIERIEERRKKNADI